MIYPSLNPYDVLFPVNDLIGHELEGDDCICGPTFVLEQTEEGDEWLLVHHRLDGEEP